MAPYSDAGGASLPTDILNASVSVEVWLGTTSPRSFLQSLLTAIRSGRSGTLWLPLPALGKVAITQRYLENYVEAGGQLYLLPGPLYTHPLPARTLTILDGKRGWLTDRDAPAGRHLTHQRALQQLLNQRSSWRQDAQAVSPELLGEGLRRLSAMASWQRLRLPLEMHFHAPSQRIPLGETVRLNWSVTGADSVTLSPGPETVASVASKLVRPVRDQEYCLVARKGDWRLTKKIIISVTHSPQLRYWLTATVGEGEERPLRSGVDLPHHYALVAGETLILHWHARDVEGVSLNGEPLPGLVGSKAIAVENIAVLNLRAASGVDVQSERITVKVFSPPATPTVPENGWEPTPGALPEALPVAPVLPKVGELLETLDAETRNRLREEWRASTRRKSWWKNLITLLQKREP
ncbi:hypothetical protein [Lewinella sp. W8]|uniref:hypothetical protein n=1 Tax=Lewinella sp. W8 TaxID=2528208 RepID=UPI0010685911|nr:hypothetical protein [Lewinella sp. W8]MTB52954.1 hypothetical protein [Lewinella sp. W8]